MSQSGGAPPLRTTLAADEARHLVATPNLVHGTLPVAMLAAWPQAGGCQVLPNWAMALLIAGAPVVLPALLILWLVVTIGAEIDKAARDKAAPAEKEPGTTGFENKLDEEAAPPAPPKDSTPLDALAPRH